jgi:hypothetical protein
MTYFPNNTLANFTTRLPKEIVLGTNDWEVGLSELHFPVNWNTIPTTDKGRIVIHYKEGGTVEWSIGAGRYRNVKSLCKEVTRRFEGYLHLTWLDAPGRVEARVMNGVHKLRLSRLLAEKLGLPRLLTGDEGYDNVHLGAVAPRSNLSAQSLYVYCDIVRHQMVGDSSVPLLRIVTVPETARDACVVTFNNIQYVPAKGGTIQTIEVDIRDDTGKPIPFNAGRVIAVLHLRKAVQPVIS